MSADEFVVFRPFAGVASTGVTVNLLPLEAKKCFSLFARCVSVRFLERFCFFWLVWNVWSGLQNHFEKNDCRISDLVCVDIKNLPTLGFDKEQIPRKKQEQGTAFEYPRKNAKNKKAEEKKHKVFKKRNPKQNKNTKKKHGNNFRCFLISKSGKPSPML